MDLKRTGTTVIVNGIIAALMGVLMLAWPGATAEVVVRIFACWLAVIGLASLIFAPKGGRSGALIVRTVLLVLLGVLIFLTPMFFAAFVTILTGFAVMFFGFLGITVSLFLRRMGVRSWWVLTVIGVLGILLGGFFLFAPQAGITALIYTLAVFILIVGGSLIALGWRLRKADQAIRSDPHRRGPDDGGGDVISGEIIE
ncbi:MAG: HdeD family acid-resistance protein [Brevibacterium sp.]|uniref:HdeD family acid-resistance protein n=1 Tax=Brevibacterium sp. GP-SGM9 TaxID=3376990 RepID=UPI0039A4A404